MNYDINNDMNKDFSQSTSQLPGGPTNLFLDESQFLALVDMIPPEEGRKLIAEMRSEAARAQMSQQIEAEKERRKKYREDINYVCSLPREQLQFKTLYDLGMGLPQLSVAFRDELLPKKRSKSVLADANFPVQSVADASLQFADTFDLIKNAMRKAGSVFAQADTSSEYEWGDGAKAWVEAKIEEIKAEKLEEMFGASCVNSYFDFANKVENLRAYWFDSDNKGKFILDMSLFSFMQAEQSANYLLGVTRQPRKALTKINPKIARMSKKISAVMLIKADLSKRISYRIYSARSSQDGVWPTSIKTCEDWNYLRFLLNRFKSFMIDSYYGASYLKRSGQDIQANVSKFIAVVESSIVFSNEVLQSLGRLANINPTEINGSASKMKSRLKDAKSDFGSKSQYAKKFANHQINTNLGFWYGLEKKEEFFAKMAGIPKSNWKRSNKQTNLYNFGMYLHDQLSSILNLFKSIIESYEMVTGPASDKDSLSGKVALMIEQGTNGMNKVNSGYGMINQNLASFSVLDSLLGIRDLNSLVECTCDGYPLPEGRFTTVQRALIAVNYNCARS